MFNSSPDIIKANFDGYFFPEFSIISSLSLKSFKCSFKFLSDIIISSF